MNESIAFNCRKLKRSNIIQTCHTREGIVHIKQEESSKPFKIFHLSKLYELFPDFVFVVDEMGDVNTSVLSSYWLITKFIIHKGYLVASFCLGGPEAAIKYLMDVVCSRWGSSPYVFRLDGGQASHCNFVVVRVMPAVSPGVCVFVVVFLGCFR